MNSLSFTFHMHIPREDIHHSSQKSVGRIESSFHASSSVGHKLTRFYGLSATLPSSNLHFIFLSYIYKVLTQKSKYLVMIISDKDADTNAKMARLCPELASRYATYPLQRKVRHSHFGDQDNFALLSYSLSNTYGVFACSIYRSDVG